MDALWEEMKIQSVEREEGRKEGMSGWMDEGFGEEEEEEEETSMMYRYCGLRAFTIPTRY